MNREIFGEQLLASSLEVLGEATFTCAEVVDELPSEHGDALAVQVDFSGPAGERGHVYLSMPQGCGAELVSNMLGVELTELTSPEEIQGGMCELLNMIVGAATHRWFGQRALCHIGIPTSADGGTWACQGLSVEVSLLTETAHGIKLAATLEG